MGSIGRGLLQFRICQDPQLPCNTALTVPNRSPKGPSTQIVGFQGPKTTQSMDFWDLKPHYLGARTLWEVFGPEFRGSWEVQAGWRL